MQKMRISLGVVMSFFLVSLNMVLMRNKYEESTLTYGFLTPMRELFIVQTLLFLFYSDKYKRFVLRRNKKIILGSAKENCRFQEFSPNEKFYFDPKIL